MATSIFDYIDWRSLKIPSNYQAQMIDYFKDNVCYFKNMSSHQVLDALKEYMISREKEVHNFPQYLWGQKLIYSSGPLLESERYHDFFKNRVSNERFKERCSEMEIITAPYHVGSWDITVHPGQEIIKDVFSQNIPLLSNYSDSIIPYDPIKWNKVFTMYRCPEIVAWQPFVRYGISVKQTPGTNNPLMLFPGFGNESIHNYPLTYIEVPTRRREVTQFSFAKEVFNASNISNDLRNSIDRSINSNLVMECLAEANSGDFDALTALAELPETIKSIINGYKFLARACQDIKKREFAIHNKREQYLKAIAKREYARYRGRDDLHTFYTKRAAYLNKLVAKQIASEVASVYLNARYNIAPTVYMLQDIGETLLNWEVEFRRTRKRLTVSFKNNFDSLIKLPPGYTASFSGTAQVTHRAFIKRLYDASDISGKLGRSLLTDISVTAFEKMTYFISIIANWFISFETALKAIRWRTVEKQQGACYSTKIEIEGTLTLRSLTNDKKTLQVDLSVNDYERRLINPSSHIALYWRNDMNIWRTLDSVAFMWNLIKGSVRPSHPTRDNRN